MASIIVNPSPRSQIRTGFRYAMVKKTEKYAPFDAADYLESIDDVAAYLEIALEESADDPTAVPRAQALQIGLSPPLRGIGECSGLASFALSGSGDYSTTATVKPPHALREPDSSPRVRCSRSVRPHAARSSATRSASGGVASTPNLIGSPAR